MKARKKLGFVIAGAVAALALGSLATAAIPDGGGVIHGCYDKNSGQLRVTDTATNQPKTCSNKETALAWNQQGPQGIQGPQGPAGISQSWIFRHEDTVPVGVDTSLFGMDEGGMASAKLVIGTTNPYQTIVSCALFSGLDVIDSSSATLNSPFGATTTLYLVGATTHKNVHLKCGVNLGSGFAEHIVLTAIGVSVADKS